MKTTTTHTGADAAAYVFAALNDFVEVSTDEQAIELLFALADATTHHPVLTIAQAYDDGRWTREEAARYALRHLFEASAAGTLTFTV